MNMPKLYRIVFLNALAIGLIFAPRVAAAGHRAATKRPPVIIFLYNQHAGPTIVPNDGETKLEYRKVLFREQSVR